MGIEGYFAGLGPAFIVLFMAPFVLLLISLATLPLLFPHFWERNKNKAIVSLAFGLPVASFFMYKDWQTLANTALDYGAFISLLGALFIISGGIYIRGSFAGRPMVNTAFLVIGSVLANLIGTTGASMLLIRPLIRANQERQRKSHIIIFFIFIVSNGAGLLTPLGDPPLFLGFLRGVDFAWTLRLWPQWLTVVGALLVAFNLVERHQFNKEGPATRASLASEGAQLADKFGIEGAHNLIFLSMVVGLIVFSGYVIYPLEGRKLLGESFGPVLSKAAQMAGMMLIALTSYQVTDKTTHHRHNFNFHPIVEVAVLFAGIFAAMIPALLILETQGGKLGVNQPSQYFWMTGALSSFLDNAPTYLAYTSLAKGALHLPGEGLKELMLDPTGAVFLTAISCGAVLMGANTYIGNGPNFMVKAIAEEARIKMPSFFGYMVWSTTILVPLFIAMTFIFFR